MLLQTMIPMQIPVSDQEAVEALSDAASAFVTAALLGNFFLNMFLSYSLNELKSAVNTMQILTHVNLMAVKQPANANRFFLYFIKLCTFELIPTDGLMDDLFGFPDRGSYNINF